MARLKRPRNVQGAVDLYFGVALLAVDLKQEGVGLLELLR